MLSPLSPPTVASRVAPFGVAVSPGGESAYIVNTNSDRVSQYDIDPSTGRLSPKVRATVPTVEAPEFIAVSPNGRSAYVTNGGASHDISQYNINPLNGRLVPKTPAAVVVPTTPEDVAVTPDSKSAYVTTPYFVVYQYDIAPNGTLSPKDPPAVNTGSGAGSTSVAVAPDGKSAYVTSANPSDPFGAGTVSQYNINPLTGKLSLKTPATVVAGPGNPFSIAVTPDGKNAYVVNLIGVAGRRDTVSQYTINLATGRLTPKVPARVAAGSGAHEVAVHPDGQSAYVTNGLDNDVSQYNINPVSGALSPKTPATVAAGTGPLGIAVAATHP